MVQGQPTQKCKILFEKIIKSKKSAGGVAHVVETLPSKVKTWSSNPKKPKESKSDIISKILKHLMQHLE
jgi:hypothetical protein